MNRIYKKCYNSKQNSNITNKNLDVGEESERNIRN